MEAILIAKLIFALHTTEVTKKNLSMCTFWGVQAGSVDLYARYERCKLKYHTGKKNILAKNYKR